MAQGGGRTPSSLGLGGGRLRIGSRLSLIAGGMVVLLCGVAPAPGATISATPTALVASSTNAQLLAERAQLEAQLQKLLAPRADARNQLLGAESALAAVVKQLGDTRHHLDATNTRLRTLSAEITADEHGLSEARVQLAALLRATYETSDRDGFAGAILAANSFSEAMDRVRGAQHVTDQVRGLQKQIETTDTGLLRERAQLQASSATAEQLEQQLSDQNGHLLQMVAERNLAFQGLDGPARDIAGRIARIDDELSSPAPPSGNYSAPCGNRFAFGYCTYYVATRRCIPWLGNAYQWWANARAAGFAEGRIPQRGAVAVWGQSGSSPVGHVAYVESVGPDGGVPAGSFLISEMNYSGWDRVDYRVVPVTAPGLLGFIYGHV